MILLLLTIPALLQCFQIPHQRSPKSFNQFNVNSIQKQSATTLNLSPQEIIDGSNVISTTLGSTSSSMLLSERDMSQLIKPALITLTLGGGLIPALISANGAMAQTLSGKRVDDDGNEIIRIKSSAAGPTLPILLANDKVPLVEVIAVIGRITNVDSLADWRNLPSTKVPNAIDPNNPPMWLPRATFKANMRKARFTSWPSDPKTNKPVGGEELKNEYEKLLKSNKLPIGDAALDAIWDSWTGGASIATPDKVKSALEKWRPSQDTFALNKFIAAATGGRSIVALGAFTFIIIQVISLGSLFIAPFLRVALNIDAGFGQLGACYDPDTCVKLFDMIQ